MIPQAQQEITFGAFQQNMGQLKRRLAQTQGEANQIISDNMSQTMDSIMNTVTQIFQQDAAKDRTIADLQTKLDDAYNAHPELKINAEAKAKESPKKGTAKKV